MSPTSNDLARYFKRVVKSRKCWLWTGAVDRDGYGLMGRHGKTPEGKYRNWKVHRLAWILANGQIPSGLSVLHRCDTRACVNPKHLFLGTQADNMRDMDKKHRRRAGIGIRHRNAKLDETDVREIRALRGKLPATKLAFIYGVGNPEICLIQQRKTWKHVR